MENISSEIFSFSFSFWTKQILKDFKMSEIFEVYIMTVKITLLYSTNMCRAFSQHCVARGCIRFISCKLLTGNLDLCCETLKLV